jgi:hypothetical protein
MFCSCLYLTQIRITNFFQILRSEEINERVFTSNKLRNGFEDLFTSGLGPDVVRGQAV